MKPLNLNLFFLFGLQKEKYAHSSHTFLLYFEMKCTLWNLWEDTKCFDSLDNVY